jgi:hypothetical protein
VADIDSIYSTFYSPDNTYEVIDGEMDMSIDIYTGNPQRFKDAVFMFVDSVTHRIVSDYKISTDKLIYDDARVTVKIPDIEITVGDTPRTIQTCIILNRKHIVYASYTNFWSGEIKLVSDHTSLRERYTPGMLPAFLTQ